MVFERIIGIEGMALYLWIRPILAVLISIFLSTIFQYVVTFSRQCIFEKKE